MADRERVWVGIGGCIESIVCEKEGGVCDKDVHKLETQMKIVFFSGDQLSKN